ncbi:MFS transporter [Pseudomonas sp. GV071]|uniref:MFS transporter n=1 Tax=Pseudomonas sp. GV071 TaxID=2135754 RepID=UPI001304FCA7|nr:MFS transporter [Pseudomonas sp. GV071]
MPVNHVLSERIELTPEPVGKVFMLAYFVAFVFIWATSLPPTFISLALKIQDLVGMQRATDVLGLVLACGALVAMLAGPIIGKLSDATSLSLGRRRPWMIAGAFISIGAAFFCGTAQSVVALLIGYCLFQVGLNAVVAGLGAVLLDRIPAEQQTRISGLLAISIPVGMVIGAFLVDFISHNFIAVFVLPTILMAVAVLYFCVIFDEIQLAATAPLVTQESSARQPGNALAWPTLNFTVLMSGRFLMGAALSVLTTYQTFFLAKNLGVSPEKVPQHVAITMLIFAIATVLAGIWVTFAEHAKTHKRQYSAGASFFAGIVFLLMGAAPSFALFLGFVVLSGFAWGLYSSVENAVVAAVLTSRDNSARDLGIYRAAAILPQMIVPLLGAVALGVLNANYSTLFVAAGLFAFLSGLFMLKVKLA